jgi:hypothetical protein
MAPARSFSRAEIFIEGCGYHDRLNRPDATDADVGNTPLLKEAHEGDGNSHNGDDEEELSNGEDDTDGFVSDPFSPFDDLPEEKENVLTFRAIAVGVACGLLINASNVYLGLKSGWTTSANLFAVGTMPVHFHVKLINHDHSRSLALPS